MNIAGKKTSLQAVPFFWTMLFGKSYRYAGKRKMFKKKFDLMNMSTFNIYMDVSGHGKSTKVKVHGSLEELKFFAYYFKDGKVIAMSSVGRDPIVADFANLLFEGKSLTEEEVESDPVKWMRNKPKDLVIPVLNTSTKS